MKIKSGKTRQICKHCGFTIRGKNHDEGQHHRTGSGGKADVSKSRY